MTKTTIADRKNGTISFDADLDVVIDGAVAHIRGDGATLIVDSSDPISLLREINRAAGSDARQRLTTMVDELALRGGSARLHGPRGRLLTVGADADAPALRWLTGTRHVQPYGLSGLMSVVTALVDRRLRRVVWVSLIAATVTTLAGWVRRSRRGRPEA